MSVKFKANNTGLIVVSLLGTVLSLVVFMAIRSAALDRFSLGFQRLASDRTMAVFSGLDLHRYEMEAFRNFFENSEEVTEQEFILYTEPMMESPGVKTLEWIPRVRSSERVDFEARTGIQIREQSAGDQLVPAKDRAEYFPIERAVPFKLNEAALGFDLASNPERWTALETARDQGKATAMELVRLVEEPTAPPVFMMVSPVFKKSTEGVGDRRRNLCGFVLGMYRLDQVVKVAMDRISPRGLSFFLEDLDAAPGNRLLYRHESRLGTFDWDRAQDAPFKFEKRMDGLGRTWRITVLPNETYVQTHLSRAYRWILPVGLLFTLLVTQLLRMQLHGRRRAEFLVQERTAALRESEEQLRMIFRIADNVGFITTDAAGMDTQILGFSPGAEKIFGYTAEELFGERVSMLHLVGDVERFSEIEQARGYAGEMTMLRKSGEPLLALLTIHPNFDASGTLVGSVGVVVDITERKQAEQALQESETRFKALHNASFGGIAIHDQGIILECNRGLSELTGYQDEELLGMDGLLLIAENMREIVMGNIRSGYEKPYEVVGVRKDGQEYLLRLEARNIPYKGKDVRVVEFRDITERKQVEQEKDRLLAAIDQAAETIVITDLDGTIEYVNPAFEKITGYTREEVMGQTPRIFKSGEHNDAFYRAMWKTLLERGTWKGRLINRKKNGIFYTEEATISPVIDATGEVINYVAIKADITDELAREKQVRQSQKMESIGRLAGGVAHDFNNILQTITGFCGLILAEMDRQSAQRQDVVEIQKAAQHAGELTQQLLAFSRVSPTEYKELKLNAILADGENMLRQALDESFQLDFNPEAGLAPVRADASQILQIAMNLIVNARDAMPGGGTITLAMKTMEITKNNRIDWPNSKVGKWVCLSVSDTGCGMDEKQLAHLFEPFYTTKPLGQGTGLGLSVVYGIVEEHGGWISVSSEPGKGSVFSVCLPVQGPAGSGNGDASAGLDAFLGKRILLVEDDSVIRELTAEILQDVGYAVTVAADTDEAEQLFSGKRGAFDMLFSDVVLPGRTGVELAGFCREQQPELPVLLFSGYSDERIQVELIHEKGFNYIRKPFNLKKLLDAVSQTITGFQR